MNYATRNRIDRTTGVSRSRTTKAYKAGLKRNIKNRYRRKSMGGQGG